MPGSEGQLSESVSEQVRAGGHGAATTIWTRLAVGVATAGGVGFGPWAPGTWGALVAVVAFGLLYGPNGHGSVGPIAYLAGVAAVTAVGIRASTVAEGYFDRHDDGRIVIDEVAGQLISLFPILWFSSDSFPSTDDQNIFWGSLVVTGFVAFRWFDIRKPGPVKWAEERFEGGLGVMADDVVAGVLGAVVVLVAGNVMTTAFPQ